LWGRFAPPQKRPCPNRRGYGYTNITAKELRGRNITVNAIAPGPTATNLFYQGKSAELIEKFAHQAPLERLGQPVLF
jgi:NAD(P)-dependent dehydrogenase (short-subunit alcohol dehydrogenase family)